MAKGKTILFTGAADFVGKRAASMACEMGVFKKVIAVDSAGSDLTELESMGVKAVNGNLTKIPDLIEILDGVDILIHTGSVFDLSLSGRELMETNFRLSRNLAQAGAEAGVSHFIFCSSAEVYGSPDKSPINETFRLTPESDYGFSMVRAEQACVKISAEYEMPTTILRPSLIYGPEGIHIPSLFCVAPYMINNYFGFAVKLSGGPMLNAGHVDDVAGALLYLAEKPKTFGNAYNISDMDWLCLGEFIEKMWEPTGIKWKLKIPVMKLPIKLASYFGNIMVPDFAFDILNSIIAGQWKKIIKKKGIKPAFSPRYDRDMFNYTLSDRVYDNSALINLGYKLKFPKFDQGYEQAMASFKEKNWVPEDIS